jgi:hypothetical protein
MASKSTKQGYINYSQPNVFQTRYANKVIEASVLKMFLKFHGHHLGLMLTLNLYINYIYINHNHKLTTS